MQLIDLCGHILTLFQNIFLIITYVYGDNIFVYNIYVDIVCVDNVYVYNVYGDNVLVYNV